MDQTFVMRNSSRTRWLRLIKISVEPEALAETYRPTNCSQAHAVHLGEIGQIQHDLLRLRDQPLHLVPQNAGKAGGQLAGAMDDSGVAFRVSAKAQGRGWGIAWIC